MPWFCGAFRALGFWGFLGFRALGDLEGFRVCRVSRGLLAAMLRSWLTDYRTYGASDCKVWFRIEVFRACVFFMVGGSESRGFDSKLVEETSTQTHTLGKASSTVCAASFSIMLIS